jgi:hypothetical protein
MFELLVPAELGQLGQVEGDKNAYDLQIRPHLMAQTIQALQDAGVEPDVWKVEGLDRQEDAVKVVEVGGTPWDSLCWDAVQSETGSYTG